jgi:hypothetical protein
MCDLYFYGGRRFHGFDTALFVTVLRCAKLEEHRERYFGDFDGRSTLGI